MNILNNTLLSIPPDNFRSVFLIETRRQKMSNFVSEADLEEARKNRQAEWERVRKADDPEEAPEEEYDHRSLFERLEENRRVKVCK